MKDWNEELHSNITKKKKAYQGCIQNYFIAKDDLDT